MNAAQGCIQDFFYGGGGGGGDGDMYTPLK